MLLKEEMSSRKCHELETAIFVWPLLRSRDSGNQLFLTLLMACYLVSSDKSSPQYTTADGMLPKLSSGKKSCPQYTTADGMLPWLSSCKKSSPQYTRADGMLPWLSSGKKSSPQYTRADGMLPWLSSGKRAAHSHPTLQLSVYCPLTLARVMLTVIW